MRERNTSEIGKYVYLPDSSPHNATYKEWLKRYLKRMIETPVYENGEISHPAFDPDGRLCSKIKEDNVVYLYGTFLHTAERELSVPKGTDLLVVSILKNDSVLEDETDDLKILFARLLEGISYVTNRYLKVNDTEIEPLDDFLTHTGFFEVKFPPKEVSIYPIQGRTTVIGMGWVCMIKGDVLKSENKIEFGATASIPTSSIIYQQLINNYKAGIKASEIEKQRTAYKELQELLLRKNLYEMQTMYHVNID